MDRANTRKRYRSVRMEIVLALLALLCGPPFRGFGQTPAPTIKQPFVREAMAPIDHLGLNVDSPILNQTAKLTASDGVPGDEFGGNVSTAADTVVVGAPYAPGHGAAYVFVKPPTGWANATQTAKLTTSDGSQLWAVAVSGRTVVAAWGGAAYVFAEPPTGWADMTETAKLTASNGDSFYSVGISGNTVIAGAPYANYSEGAAYVFVKPPGGWADMTESAKLTASDGMPYDDMGFSVAIARNTAVAGAVGASGPGAAYVFVEPQGGWANTTENAKLTASDGNPDDFLGCTVGISGDTVVAGAPNVSVGKLSWLGADYVFAKPANGWANMTQTAKLRASDAGFTDQLGNGAGISGNFAVAGAPQYEPFGNTGAGKVYVFKMPAGGWSSRAQNVELVASDGVACSALGVTVSISGVTVVAGAPGVCAGGGRSGEPGAAYVFALP
ncbi:MAG TPA: FG-GAP repeat protein [Terriglobia bacterium]|nr:FG-GAP repeat protein [Terriglobia bacterium]